MTKTHWYLVAGFGALVVLWFLFVRKPATVLAPPAASALPRIDGGILGQINSGATQVKTLFGTIFGSGTTTAAASSPKTPVVYA